jgi:predicted nuclease of restriction endonuclease-like (RecB) superfamily
MTLAMPRQRKTPVVAALTKRVSAVPSGYARLLADIKSRISVGQLRATQAANRELVLLYWDIGHLILNRQKNEGWGAKVIDRLAGDLKRAFPDMQGFSPRNLKYMRAFAAAYPAREFVQAPLAQITWYHHVTLLDKIREPAERLWYAGKAVEHGWSRDIMALQISSGLFHRQGKAATNFQHTLPPLQSDLARQALKDPYVFDFLTLTEAAREREAENALMEHLTEFLLELGAGFAFVGRQVRLEIGHEDFSIDLLFYHLKLRCFVVIDLKTRFFVPEDAGKMNFYLNAVDDRLRHPQDHPSIGLILCRRRESARLVLEYALRGMNKPIGVSQYELTRALPANLKPSLPTVEEIEAELVRDLKQARSKTKPRRRAS